jgi:hypothetical protein
MIFGYKKVAGLLLWDFSGSTSFFVDKKVVVTLGS